MKLITWKTVYKSKIMLMFLASIMTVQGQGYPGEILTGPQTQVVVPGEIAHFICHARGDSIYWYINNTDPHPQSIYEARGFSFSYTVLSDPRDGPEEHNNTITVEARYSNNSTRIACNAVGTYSNQHAFQEGTLIIAGPPSSPVVNFTQGHLIDGFVHSHLSWSTPFTFPHLPITNYTVTMFNHSNGETITTIRTSNYADYSHQSLSQGDHCYELDFTVVAANRLGSSPPATIHTGHPIVPGEIDEIETVVTFLSVPPHLWMSFLAPRICPYSYQTGSYNITIYDLMNQSVVHLGPTEYTQMNESEQILIAKEVRTELAQDEYYVVEVVIKSIGVVRMKRKNINTFINGVPPKDSVTTRSNIIPSNTSKQPEILSTSAVSYTLLPHSSSMVNIKPSLRLDTLTTSTEFKPKPSLTKSIQKLKWQTTLGSKQLTTSTVFESTTTESKQGTISNRDGSGRTQIDSGIATGIALGAIACFSGFVIIALLTVFIIRQRKRNHVQSTDGGAAEYSKPSKSQKRTKPVALSSIMASNPIYEGPVYEPTPGEAIKPLISPSSCPSTPADATPRYFDMPPKLPPPRNGSVAALPKLETLDEIDAIKASIQDAEIRQSRDESQYMIMNGAKPSNRHAHDADASNVEDVYTMMK